MKNNIFNTRRFKHGALATVVSVGFIAILVLINVVASLLLERYPLTIDLTSDHRFALTEDSVNFVKTIDRDVKITVCAEESEFEGASTAYKQAYEVLKNYSRYSDRIQLNFVDLLKNPSFAQGYPDLTLNAGDIIVETDLRSKVLSYTDLFNIETSYYQSTLKSSKAEQAFTGALMYVTEDNPVRAAVVTNNTGVDVSAYKTLLTQNNYEIGEVSLATGEIDPELSFLILPQPKADLTEDEVTRLNTFLENDGEYGKGVAFVAATDVEIQPRLKAFLADWGLEVTSEFVAEMDASRIYTTVMGQNPYMMNVDIADSEIAASGNLAVQNTREIKLLFEASGNRKTKAIAQTSGSAILVPTDAENFDASTAEKGVRTVMAVGTRGKSSYSAGEELHDSYVVAFGSEGMLQSYLLTEAGFANANVVLSVANTYAKKDNSIQITPVDMQSTSITVTAGQARGFMIVLQFVIPIAILAVGVIVWLRRRHL